jgi:hypothetical protein
MLIYVMYPCGVIIAIKKLYTTLASYLSLHFNTEIIVHVNYWYSCLIFQRQI